MHDGIYRRCWCGETNINNFINGAKRSGNESIRQTVYTGATACGGTIIAKVVNDAERSCIKNINLSCKYEQWGVWQNYSIFTNFMTGLERIGNSCIEQLFQMHQ